MSKTNVTLKQIAELAGVSAATVHRVLNNKGGYSEELKEKVLKIAQEEGYSVNYVASSLRKHTLHIALLFPEYGKSSRYFLQSILDGYLQFRNEVAQFNVVFQEYYFSASNHDSNRIENFLKNIFYERPVSFDGIVVYGIFASNEAVMLLNRLVGRRIPIVMLEKIPDGLDSVCCVRTDDQMAGKLGGELLAKLIRRSGTVVVLNQVWPGSGKDQNGQACEKEILLRRKDLKVCQYGIPLESDQSLRITGILRGIPDLAGIYATCARHTDYFLQALKALKQKPDAAVGSELFLESVQALEKGTLDAVIDKRPHRMGYYALKILFDHIVKNEAFPEKYEVVPRIILHANSTAYLKKEEDYNGSGKFKIE